MATVLGKIILLFCIYLNSIQCHRHHITIGWGRSAIAFPPAGPENALADYHVIIVARDQPSRGPPQVFPHRSHGPRGQPPSEIMYRRGGTQPVVLDCQTDHDTRERGARTYTWTKNGTALEQNSDVYFTQEDSRVLLLKPQSVNEGDYQCFVHTDIGVASSQLVKVREAYLDVESVTEASYEPVEGKPFSIPCNVPKGYPEPALFWELESTSDPNVSHRIRDRRIFSTPDGTLWFSSFLQPDVVPGFRYVCKAASPATFRPVSVTSVDITSVAKNTSVDNTTSVVAQYLSGPTVALRGHTTELFCVYGGTPQPHPDWSKDGTDVNGSPGSRISRYNQSYGRRLTVRETRMGDEGNYTCEVEGGSHSIPVTVNSEPFFTIPPPKDVQSPPGQNLTIYCQVSATPEPTISWTYNAVPLQSSDRITVGVNSVTIREAVGGDTGYYRCVGANQYGMVAGETALVVA